MRTICLILVALLCVPAANSATINATTAALADVETAVAAAVDGDTVVIPAGTEEWDSRLHIAKAITLQGAGIGSTIIQDNSPSGGTFSNQSVVSIQLVADKTTRVTGIEFQAGTRATDNVSGTVYIFGINTNGGRARIDNCKFDTLNNRASIFVNGALGVADNCEMILNGNQFAFDIRHDNWNGQASADGSWADDPLFGTDNFWYVEDCTMEQTGSLYECIDTYGGARWVMRHNTLINSRWGTHGTESTGRSRGTRAIEIYANTVTGNGVASSALGHRSGTALIYSNVLSSWNAGLPAIFSAVTYRVTDRFSPWGGADGTNAWDLNDTTNNPFATGTATGGGSLTMTDSGASWTVNQWTGYVLHNTTSNTFSEILSNTATTVTVRDSLFTDVHFASGDAYAIRLVLAAIDQPGVGKGDLINISSPAWPNQAVEPIYAWNNTQNGSPALYGALHANAREDVHFFNDTPMPGYTAYTYPHPLRNAGYTPTIVTNNASGARVMGFRGLGMSVLPIPSVNTTADLWQAFEFTDPTVANLDANDNTSTGTWLTNDNTVLMSISTSGERALTGTINGSSDTGHTRGLRKSHTANDTANVQFDLGGSATGTISAGTWWKFVGPTPGASKCILLFAYSGGTVAEVLMNTTTKTVGFSGGSNNGVALVTDTWYWITAKIVKNSTSYISVYDTTGTLVGTEVTGTAANQDTRFISLGRGLNETADNSILVYWDDLVLDWTDATYPLGL